MKNTGNYSVEAASASSPSSDRHATLPEEPPVTLEALRKKEGYRAPGRRSKWWRRLFLVRKSTHARKLSRYGSTRSVASAGDGSRESDDNPPQDEGPHVTRKKKVKVRRRRKESEGQKAENPSNYLASQVKRTGNLPTIFRQASHAGPAQERWKALSKHYCPKMHMRQKLRWSEGYICSPEECIKLFRTSHNITALIKTLIKANDEWMIQFLSIGGLRPFFQSFEQCFLRAAPYPLWQALGQIGCCRVLRKIMNMPEGLDAIVDDEYCITSLALGKQTYSICLTA